MRRYYKGSDIPFRLSIKDKGGVIIPLASFDSLEVIFRTSGEQYTKYYKGGGITENEDGTYRIYASENAFGLLPDGLLKYTVKYTLNGTHDEIKECETDIFIKTPKQFQPKANVQDKSITVTENNSVSRVIPDGGYEGLGEVTVNVEIPFPMEIKEVNITENESTTTITTGEGYSGMSEVNVNVKVPITIKLPNGIKFAYSNIEKFPDGFDWSEIRDVRTLFMYMSNIKDLSNIEILSQPTDMTQTFYESHYIEKFPKIDTSKVTTIESCFYSVYYLESIPYDFSDGVNADSAFGDSGIKDIPSFIGKASNITGCFINSNLTSIPDMTFEATYIRRCFLSCSKLLTCGTLTFIKATDATDFINDCDALVNIGGVISDTLTNITGMMCDCSSLESIGDLNCPNLTNIYGFAWGNPKLKKAPHFLNSSKLQDIHMAYKDCISLEEIPGFDCTNVNYTDSFVYNCPALTTVGALQNLKVSIDFSSSPLLTVESLMNIINGLATASATLTLGSANLAKLSDEQKAVATSKGWTLA